MLIFQSKYLKIKSHSFPIFHNMIKKNFANPHITYKLNRTNFSLYSCYPCHYINTTYKYNKRHIFRIALNLVASFHRHTNSGSSRLSVAFKIYLVLNLSGKSSDSLATIFYYECDERYLIKRVNHFVKSAAEAAPIHFILLFEYHETCQWGAAFRKCAQNPYRSCLLSIIACQYKTSELIDLR